MAFVLIPKSYGSPLWNPYKNSINLCGEKKKKKEEPETLLALESLAVYWPHGQGEPRAKLSQTLWMSD